MQSQEPKQQDPAAAWWGNTWQSSQPLFDEEPPKPPPLWGWRRSQVGLLLGPLPIGLVFAVLYVLLSR